MTRKSLSLTPLAGLLTLSLAAASVGGAAAAVAPPSRTAYPQAGQTGPRSAVPWKEVGPGWVLSIYWPGRTGFSGKPKAAAPVLYLFNPAGGKYQLRRWPATKNPPFVSDWSGDKTRALLSTLTKSGIGTEQIVLATGKISRIQLPKQLFVIGYTRPTGQGLLTFSSAGKEVQFARYDLNGKLAKVLISDAAGVSAVYSGSGTVLAVNAPHGIWLVSNNGGITAKLGVPGSGAGCIPARWWNSTTILASCLATKKSRSRLWLVPADGSKAHPLTSQYGKHSPDPGNVGAWQLRGRVYLQALARSGRDLIFRQSAGHLITAVPVPHVPNDDVTLTARGSRLLIIAPALCSDRTSLLWLNPATGKEQLLINTRPDLTGAQGAVPFGGLRLADFFIAVSCSSVTKSSVTKRTVRF